MKAESFPGAAPAESEPESTAGWHLALSYDGTDFHGWQVQPNVRTVQGELLQRLRLLFREPDLLIHGTSRTDAGVHALDQHLSFYPRHPFSFDADSLHRTLDRWLPSDIRIETVRPCSTPFHARHSAMGKAYTYVIAAGASCSPFHVRYAWHVPRQLNTESMRATAQTLVGTHDFATFAANPRRDIETTVRTVHAIDVHDCSPFLYLNVVGDSFLYKMVRTLTGFLVHVGLAEAPPSREEVHGKLQAADRTVLGADTAPPQGLYLAKVFFDPEDRNDYVPRLPPFAAG